MVGADKRIRKLLKVQRDCECSRLEGQVMAAAYELVTPLRRRALITGASGTPTRSRKATAQPQPRTGGSHA
jgi:hypothetical protein